MTASNDLNYAAIITITLPGSDDTATAKVLLAGSDEVTANGRTRRLADCTLADLRAFADQLEAEVWDTYQAITLLELADEAVIELKLLADTNLDAMPAGWLEQAIVLPEPTPSPEADPDETAVAPTASNTEAATTELMETDETDEADEANETAVPEPEPTTTDTEVEDIPVIDEQAAEAAEEAAAEPTAAAAPPAESAPEPELEPEKPVEIFAPPRRDRTAGIQHEVGHPTWMAVDVEINETPLRAAQAHALSSMRREVAGVLVGPRPEKQPDGRYLVRIIDSIIAEHTVMQGASVTYTPESWRYMNDELNRRYPDETAVIVGWYHTHPGFGIFLSGMDQFIHQNFFTQIWHVALVLDPHAHTAGFFCWDRTQTRVSPMEIRWPNWAQSW